MTEITKKKAARKSKMLSVKKETVRDLDVRASNGNAIRGGAKSAKCFNSDACQTALANCPEVI